MTELELSIMAHGQDPASRLHALLEHFETERHVRVHITVLPWETGWAELVKVALYGHGPDVSEIGTTWGSNLIAMNALRPFDARELPLLGGSDAFLPQVWDSGTLRGEQQMWAIPWLGDTRAIFYRRDWLELAGLDPAQAFSTHAALENTLATLQGRGIAVPWAVPTAHSLNVVHGLASWIWGAQGDFVSADGQQTAFTQPAALAGIRAYFGLYRFLAPEARGLTPDESSQLFLAGRAAMCLSGPWTWGLGTRGGPGVAPEVTVNLGAALPPGVPFVGGSNLVIWGHTRDDRGALDLVRELTSRQTQSGYSQQTGLLPVRHDALAAPPFTTDPAGATLARGLNAGRSFPVMRLWGLVEDKLATALTRIGMDLFADSRRELDDLIHQHLDPLAQTLDRTLAGR